MNIQEFLKKVVGELKRRNIRFGIAGGLVASIYRAEERFTKDLDFLIFSESKTQTVAEEIIKFFGLTPFTIRKADLEGGPLFAVKKKNTSPYIIVGRDKNDPEKIGLDFILPEMPWFQNALDRAEQNKIDFGFDKIPCLTVEDVIIAKFYSYKNDQSRFNDLDDLKSIFSAKHALDLVYLSGQMQRLALKVPKLIQKMVPRELGIISKKINF